MSIPSSRQQQSSLLLTPLDQERLLHLCGPCDENLRLLEEYLSIKIHNRGHDFQLFGPGSALPLARDILIHLYEETEQGEILTPQQIHLLVQTHRASQELYRETTQTQTLLKTEQGKIKARGANQQQYIDRIGQYVLNFGIGPAGTGKTYLAIAAAVAALKSEKVKRIILARPVVEAGEHLGFLPGNIEQKVDPYFRPLYDALYEMLGVEQVTRLIANNTIEIAPLAYMRGRTLHEAFILLDEGQNTTREQMKMFLTRMGFGSTVVITGDVTQIDLPQGKNSGLKHVLQVLANVPGISFTQFTTQDVVRHPLVQSIVHAYEKYEQNLNTLLSSKRPDNA